MPFNFRLEKVLKFRRRIMEKHTREVARADRAVWAVQKKMDNLAEDVDRLINNNLSSMDLNLDVPAMISRGHRLDHLGIMQDEVRKEVDEAQVELSHQRSLLTKSWQDLEVLQRLRAKQKLLWQEEKRMLENKEMDEVGQIRADRLQREKISCL